MSVGWNASLHIITIFFYRKLQGNALTGTIPRQMSTLPLAVLYAPCLDQIVDCWSYVLLSVGLVRLFLSLSR